MTYTIISTSVPLHTIAATTISVASSNVPPFTVVPAETTFLSTVNNGFARAAAGARYGSGIHAVPIDPANTGALNIAITMSGLTATVAPGRAVIDGVVELVNSTNVTCTDNARTWIYLNQDASITPMSGTLTPPTGNCVLLGSVLCASGDTVSIDYSGVMFLRGGLPIRFTSDSGAPADTPPSSVSFFGLTLGGLYLWDGTYWRLLDMPNNSVTSSILANGVAVRSIAGPDASARTDAITFADGTGITISRSTNAFTFTNSGVTSAVAGTGITVSGSTGAVTFGNGGVLSVDSATGAVVSVIEETPSGTIDGSNTTFTLAHTPLNTPRVYIAAPSSAQFYRVAGVTWTSGTSFTLSTAPASSSSIFCDYEHV